MKGMLAPPTCRLVVFNERTQVADCGRLLRALSTMPLKSEFHHKAGITGTCTLGPFIRSAIELPFAPSHAFTKEQAFHRTYLLAQRLEAQGYVELSVRGSITFEVTLTALGAGMVLNPTTP